MSEDETMQVIDDVILEHAQEAAFLWLQRDTAVHHPQFALRQLAVHDDRITAHLEGLRLAAAASQKACEGPLAEGEPGGLFAPTVLALEARDAQRIESLMATAEDVAALRPGLVSAFGWASAKWLHGIVKDLLASRSPFRRSIALAACAMHDVDPGEPLRSALIDSDPLLRARALRTAGQVGRRDLVRSCASATNDEDAECRFFAAWSAVLLGDRNAAPGVLVQMATTDSPRRVRAFHLALQAIGGKAHDWLRHIAANPHKVRDVIEGTGIVGDPKYVPWLVKHMRTDKLARVAGEAFTLITGAQLGVLELDRTPPETFESGPTDDHEDEDVAMDRDEGLPWPDPERIERWWVINGSRFRPGIQYFMGNPVTREHCIDVLRNGYQRQRILAAHYLCLLEPGTPLFNTSAPAWRQQRLLAQMV